MVMVVVWAFFPPPSSSSICQTSHQNGSLQTRYGRHAHLPVSHHCHLLCHLWVALKYQTDESLDCPVNVGASYTTIIQYTPAFLAHSGLHIPLTGASHMVERCAICTCKKTLCCWQTAYVLWVFLEDVLKSHLYFSYIQMSETEIIKSLLKL